MADDWRSECSDIASIQNKARIDTRFTDVQFVIRRENTQKVFHAHKLILACASPVFERMFYGAWADKRRVVELTDDDPEAFDMLLNYIYGKSSAITSVICAVKCFIIGDKYLVPLIQDSAKKYIQSISLSENDFYDIIESGVFPSLLSEDKIRSSIMENASKIVQSERFLNAPESIVNTVLQMDELNVREYDLLLAVTRWGYKNIHPINSKELIGIYKHIRFSTMTSNEFLQFIDANRKAINDKSSLAILLHLKAPSRHTLPKWCCVNQVSRNEEYRQQSMKGHHADKLKQNIEFYDSDDDYDSADSHHSTIVD